MGEDLEQVMIDTSVKERKPTERMIVNQRREYGGPKTKAKEGVPKIVLNKRCELMVAAKSLINLEKKNSFFAWG